MSEQVFLYCERASAAGFWAEPVNALSNAAFGVAAVFIGWRVARQAGLQPRARAALLALSGVVGLVGVGSFAFHTLATRAAQVFDVVPIGVFIMAALWLVLRWALQWPVAKAVLGLGGLAVATAVAVALMAAVGCQPGEEGASGLACLNGGWTYLPAFGALIGCAALVRRRQLEDAVAPAQTAWFAVAILAFAVALAARSLDLAACWPGIWLSLHAVWHIGAAMAAYAVLRSLIAAAPRV